MVEQIAMMKTIKSDFQQSQEDLAHEAFTSMRHCVQEYSQKLLDMFVNSSGPTDRTTTSGRRGVPNTTLSRILPSNMHVSGAS